MINFENLDKAIFPGVGKYGIPEIAPTTEYPAGEFIPMNYAMSCKNPEGKICILLWMITNLLGFGIRQTDIFLCCLGSPPCAHRIFPHTQICHWPCRFTTTIGNTGLRRIGRRTGLQYTQQSVGVMNNPMIGASMASR